MTFNGDASVELRNVIGRLWGGFARNREVLTCKHAPPARRLHFLQIMIQQSLWCVGSLNLTGRQLQMLRGAQQCMLRAVLPRRPRPDELPWDFFQRWATQIRTWVADAGYVSADELYLRAQFAWAGHVARIPSWRGHSVASDILHFRDEAWLKRCVARHGNQGHDKRFRVWRWEKPIAAYHGVRWRDTAADKNKWADEVAPAAKWRKICRKC